MMGAILEGILYGLVAGGIVLLFGVYMQRRQAKNPHGKCVYCGKTMAMVGKYATVCPHCKQTQPWADEGKDA